METVDRGKLIYTKPWLAVLLVLVLWLVYTILQTLSVLGDISENVYILTGFLPGILGVLVLLGSGLSRSDCYLQVKPLSRKGLLVLIGIFILALSAVLPFGVWQGWNWRGALLLAPASGISQELFFRAALLPAMQVIFPKHPWRALLVHSTFFGLWHIAPLFLGAPIWAVIAVMLVPFISGIGWGWQVQTDRTVLWAMVQHSLFWVIGLQFPIPS